MTTKQKQIEQRVNNIGNYIIATHSTIRSTAKFFNVSKTTVHKDLIYRLPKINPQIAIEANNILAYNKTVRHLRGGQATKNKYRLLRLA